MTADEAAPSGARAGRKAFKGLAPDGYRIRMMEPGEAERLLEIEQAGNSVLIAAGKSGLADEPVPALMAYVDFLLDHEVFVAEDKATSKAVGFAAARDTDDLYWLAELSVDPAHGRRGIGSALVEAVAQRAAWYFYRAVGLSTYCDLPCGAFFYERLHFLRVPDKDCTEWLTRRRIAETPPGSDGSDRTVMIRWLSRRGRHGVAGSGFKGGATSAARD
ncbi:GNAT family N-acetyltransferase [Aurantimonas sp. VKM B-3413]|uniref:GNAT family N-acetyltransferase n=1 Tax=Aurantimonas sp. VKM B-3413 TaxID=2779401 RepID=UPI001E465CB8|nr:GNAT family N-acetyltransferase [Aurantimonas sp. VKM B-3413]MCB8840085.1 GNAT family N-acetyltransferase [Aurantimonas sp. VKM B-3413]